MPASTIIGRVSVKVLPDTTDFRRDTERELSRVEKTIDPIKVKAEFDKDSLRIVAKQIDDWRDKKDPLKIGVKLDLSAASRASVATRLDFLARPRSVSFRPEIDNAAMAKVSTALAALSGARVLHTYFDELTDSLGRLDKAVPVIGTVALAVLGLGAAGLSAASNLAALSVSLAQIAAAGLAAPALFAGIGLGLGITIIALTDLKKALPDVYGQFQDMKHLITQNFWATAAGGIRDLTTVYLPQLGDLATKIGGFWGNLAHALSVPFKTALGPMFDNLNKSIDITSGSAGVFAGIITTLGLSGSQYLPQLATWFTNIASQFNDWLTRVASDGSLKRFIDLGIANFTALGSAIGSIGKIFLGIGEAAANAGGSVIQTFAGALNNIANIVNGPAFQKGLTDAFRAAHLAMENIASISGPAVQAFFTTLADTLRTLLPLAGTAIGVLVKSVADALSQPAFQGGLKDAIGGIAQAVIALQPAFAPLGQALGAIGQVIGAFAPVIANLLVAAFVPLSQVVTQLAPQIIPLIQVLGGGLTSVMQALGPVIIQVGQALANLMRGGILPAITSIVQTLVPILVKLAPVIGNVIVLALASLQQVLPSIATAITTLVTALAPLIPALVEALAPILPVLALAFVQIVQAVTPLLPILANLLVSIITPLLPIITDLAMTVIPELANAFTTIVQAAVPLISALASVVSFLMPILAPAIAFVAKIINDTLLTAISAIANLFQGTVQVVMGVLNTFIGLFTGNWTKFWNGIKEFFSGVWNLIKGLFEAFLVVGILGIASKGLGLIKGVFEAGWGGIKAIVIAVWDTLKAAWSTFLQTLESTPGAVLDAIKALFKAAWDAIKTGAEMAWDAVSTAFSTGINAVRDFLVALPDQCVQWLGNIGQTLVDAGRSLISGFIDGIKSMIGSVKDTLGNLTSKLTSWKGPEPVDRVLLFGAGQLVIDGFINGLESRYDAVRKSLQGLTKDVEGTSMGSPTASLASRVSGAIDASATGASGGRTLIYHAAPGSSINSEEDLFAAADRERMFGW